MIEEAEISSSAAPPVDGTPQSTPTPTNGSQREEGSGNHRHSRRSHRHRSRSGRRSNTRGRHSSTSNRQQEGTTSCRVYCKCSDRNFAAAACSMVSIVLLSTALEPEWIYLSGGRCHEMYDAPGTMKTLSTAQFFFNGHFYKHDAFTDDSDTVYKFGPGSHNFMINCVTYTVVLLFKLCIAFTFIAVICSFCAFLLDLISPKYPLLWLLRQNSVLNVTTVLLCILLNMLSYSITSSVEQLQLQHPLHPGMKVKVTFGASFYLVTCAGVMSVLATACNCLEKRSVLPRSHHHETCSARGCSDFHGYFDDTEALLSQLSQSPADDALPSTLLMSDPLSQPPPPEYSLNIV